MYKIVFVVAVFVFAFQGAFSSPVGETEVEKVSNSEIQPKNVADSVETTQAPATVTEAAITTTAPKSGASSSEVCILLVQVSSLALIAKQMLL